MTVPSTAARTIPAWKWPWIVILVGIYAMGVPWIGYAIVVRYWLHQDYNAVLVGLDNTMARKVTMVGHMSLGAICLLLGPWQFLPVIRRKWSSLHRWVGRIYIVSALLCSMLGLIFICLKGFRLVGGINMGLAFCTSGLLFGTSAAFTLYFARRRAWNKHRNWAIRSFCQILAPLLYRYWYLLLGGLQLYPSDQELVCDERDICQPFTNTLDAIHAWTYFLVPWAVAELIIHSLSYHQKTLDTTTTATTPSTQELSTNGGTVLNQLAVGELEEQNVLPTTTTTNEDATGGEGGETFNYQWLNRIGFCGAVVSISSTGIIYITSFLGYNTVSTR